MSQEDLTIRLGLTGQAQTKRGIDDLDRSVEGLSRDSREAGARARTLGANLTTAGRAATVAGATSRQLGAGLRMVGNQTRYGTIGLGALALAGAKWGLSFNAQVENARIRFGLFTDDVDGLMGQIRQIDAESATFGFAQLADAAAMLGNSDVKNIPDVLRGAANAAAAGGRGADGLQSIVLALSQIQSKGKVSQEEINQLNEAGAPGTQKIIADAFGLTAKQLGNLGGQGLDATKALEALTAAWTSGRMADAAKRQGQTLSGQWSRLTTNVQTLAGAVTFGLAGSLSRDVLPAANRATEAITAMFGDKGLSNEQKMRRARQIISRELGPFATDLRKKLDDADIPGHLGELVGAATPKMAKAAADAAPEAAKAFVDAWMSSGPWVQIATVLFAGKKLNGLRGAGGGGGGGGGRLGGAGKAAPVPVFVTNWGGGPDKSPTSTWTKAKRTATKAGPVALAAADVIGADLAPAFLPVAGITALALTRGNHNYATRGAGASSPSNPAGSIPAPGFGTGTPGALNIHVNVGEEQIARAVVRGDDHMANRGR